MEAKAGELVWQPTLDKGRGVGRDGDDRDYSFTGTIVPKNSVSSGCLVFCVCFENLFPVETTKRGVLVSVQTLVEGIGFEIGEGFANCLQALL